ncbi:MAG: hypothetical protein A3G33_10835 [Omnitrophica bacterium RIFCSPLOWO2_12_FULL_44_17]|uniref:Uncharacterized protein n=1 Tax=Candidatus Danuiimicrobium aquiferis TaxID=1801832 RepID=A0A1G1KR85_9BACT|nr:MAG: hypothetical protein A3B72_03155 [Omnitrophica bacterium RIFCSPHIGHO2_02_FULL_45_28]OGW88663.1 MAG: hypothetical protein A3E74_06010 [Omnitrophica bacterium RIFCSPHIGHO2_12_FULL_44_12]OGW95464.1 MAG: hypothetical protein A3G33_10835 [Omnitrophica bacterium RIFCSPLOWO2_12_FULL_44_17]
MDELNEIKKRFSEIFEILKNLIKKVYSGIKASFERRIPNPKIRMALILITACFALFFVGGSIAALKQLSGTGNLKDASIIRALFAPTIPVPGKQKDGSFVIADFESEKGLKALELIDAKLELSSQHISRGAKSAKITMYGGKEVSGLRIQHYFTSRKAQSNWTNYDAFNFYIFNSRNESERLILQVKDERENRYKQDIWIPGNNGMDFSIPIQRMAGTINVRAIDQISFFRWEPRLDLDFFMDDIRLVPKGLVEVQKTPKQMEIIVKPRPVKMLDYGFKNRKPVWMAADPRDPANGFVRIPFIVKNETDGFCKLCPAEGGIPFPMGELKTSDEIRMRNAKGEEIPFQPRALGKWPDGSIQWLGIHFETTLAPLYGNGYFMEYGPTVKRVAPEGKLKIEETDDQMVINTGVMQAILSKKEFYLFKDVIIDMNRNETFDADEHIVSDAALTLDFRGEEYRTNLDQQTYKIEIEEKGTQRAVVKASGWFQSEKGNRYCQAIVRYYFYQGKSYVKVSHTLIYTGYPSNTYYEKYKGLKLPENETIQSFGIKIPLQLNEVGSKVLLAQEKTGIQEILKQGEIKLYQALWDAGELVRGEKVPERAEAYQGFVDVSDDLKGVTVAIRNFRENFPKAFRAGKDFLEVDLWPKESGDLDLSTTSNAIGPEDVARGNAFGLAKTHELLFNFHDVTTLKEEVVNIAKSFMKPLLIRTNPYWVDATGALGRLFPAAPQYATEEKMLEKLFDWAARQQRDFKWYGMLNFGDTLSWWRNEDEEQWYGDYGWHPIGRWGWYNCEGVGTHMGALLQFARTGNWKYFEFGRNSARHIMDVDTVHFNTVANDDRLKNILDEEVSQVGSMHRHSGDHWSGRNEESSHTHVSGILLYYYLTGDERAFDVAKEVGEFFLKEPFTYTGHADVAPHRAMANALWGDVLLYHATGDERFKKTADRIIEIYLKGQQSDGSILENYNPLDQTWSGEKHRLYMDSYAVGAFMAYHELTQDEEVKQMFLKMIKFLDVDPAALNGIAYAYFISGDQTFLEMLNKSMNELLANKQESSDSLMDGMIYKKQIYHRPNTYLFSAPYAFEALEAGHEAINS